MSVKAQTFAVTLSGTAAGQAETVYKWALKHADTATISETGACLHLKHAAATADVRRLLAAALRVSSTSSAVAVRRIVGGLSGMDWQTTVTMQARTAVAQLFTIRDGIAYGNLLLPSIEAGTSVAPLSSSSSPPMAAVHVRLHNVLVLDAYDRVACTASRMRDTDDIMVLASAHVDMWDLPLSVARRTAGVVIGASAGAGVGAGTSGWVRRLGVTNSPLRGLITSITVHGLPCDVRPRWVVNGRTVSEANDDGVMACVPEDDEDFTFNKGATHRGLISNYPRSAAIIASAINTDRIDCAYIEYDEEHSGAGTGEGAPTGELNTDVYVTFDMLLEFNARRSAAESGIVGGEPLVTPFLSTILGTMHRGDNAVVSALIASMPDAAARAACEARVATRAASHAAYAAEVAAMRCADDDDDDV